IPVYNEEESLPSLYSELQEVLSSLNIQYEIIFINDGSTDKSLSVLKEIYSKDSSHIRIIDLRRNFGQTAALLAGFQHARGDLVLSLDADGQNDPHDIPLLLNTLTEEIDVICGWRYPRHDPFFRKILPSRVSNFLNRKINNLDIHDSGCTLRLYRIEAVKNLSLMRGEHRYIPAILSHQGFNISEVKVNHRPRVKGKSKYGFNRLFSGFFDLFMIKLLSNYNQKPIRLFAKIGFLFLITAFSLGTYLLIVKYALGQDIGDRPLLLLTLLLGLSGFQFLLSGFMTELIVRHTSYVNNPSTDITYHIKKIYE
ncbi:MAG: glycosyltransferase family 2 protein, partial [Candidatus Heimdallarchaeaceae archaeon]